MRTAVQMLKAHENGCSAAVTPPPSLAHTWHSNIWGMNTESMQDCTGHVVSDFAGPWRSVSSSLSHPCWHLSPGGSPCGHSAGAHPGLLCPVPLSPLAGLCKPGAWTWTRGRVVGTSPASRCFVPPSPGSLPRTRHRTCPTSTHVQLSLPMSLSPTLTRFSAQQWAHDLPLKKFDE